MYSFNWVNLIEIGTKFKKKQISERNESKTDKVLQI